MDKNNKNKIRILEVDRNIIIQNNNDFLNICKINYNNIPMINEYFNKINYKYDINYDTLNKILLFACNHTYIDLFKCIIKIIDDNYEHIHINYDKILLLICENNCINIISHVYETIKKNNIIISKKIYNSCFILASNNGCLEIIQWLITLEKDINNINKLLFNGIFLDIVCQNKYFDIVKWLLSLNDQWKIKNNIVKILIKEKWFNDNYNILLSENINNNNCNNGNNCIKIKESHSYCNLCESEYHIYNVSCCNIDYCENCLLNKINRCINCLNDINITIGVYKKGKKYYY